MDCSFSEVCKCMYVTCAGKALKVSEFSFLVPKVKLSTEVE